MNFLGHFLLAGNNEDLIVGNFIADFIKGKSYQEFPEGIAKGILMHREIDFFTDNHHAFKQSKKRINKKHNHFSGVIIDIFYDHFLAADFEKIAGAKLGDFAEMIYKIIEKNWHVVPPPSKHMFTYMKRDNWLKRYEELNGIERTLNGMSRRIGHMNLLDKAIVDLQMHYDDMKNDFNRFISDAFRYFHNWPVVNGKL